MAFKDNIYKASDFTFKDGYIICDGLYMTTPRACCVPKEVLESMKETFQIKLKPCSEFAFNPPTDINRFFKAMYKSYIAYLKNLLIDKNVEAFKEGVDESFNANLDLRFCITEKGISKIESKGGFEISPHLPKQYSLCGTCIMTYNTIDEIVEYGVDVPSEYEEKIENSDIFFEPEEYIAELINKAIIKRFIHLNDNEIGIILNAPKYKNGKVVCNIVSVEEGYVNNSDNAFVLQVDIEKLGLNLYYLVDVSGEELGINNKYTFAEKDIEVIEHKVKTLSNGIGKDAFEETLLEIKEGTSKLQIVPIDEMSDDFPVKKMLKDKASKVFGFYDLDNHESDDYINGWWIKPSVYTYILINQSEKAYLGAYEIMLYSCDSKKATYYFYTNEEDYMQLVFAIWSYFSSCIRNKRQNFNQSLFRNFGMKSFSK